MVKHTQTICWVLETNCFSVFDHFVRLALEGLTMNPDTILAGPYVITTKRTITLAQIQKFYTLTVQPLFCIYFS